MKTSMPLLATLVCGLMLGAVFFHQPARSDNAATEPERIEHIEQLERRVAELERRLDETPPHETHSERRLLSPSLEIGTLNVHFAPVEHHDASE